MRNWIFGMMQVRWTVRNIAGAFGVSSDFARQYLQPCSKPEQVLELLAARAAINCEVA